VLRWAIAHGAPICSNNALWYERVYAEALEESI